MGLALGIACGCLALVMTCGHRMAAVPKGALAAPKPSPLVPATTPASSAQSPSQMVLPAVANMPHKSLDGFRRRLRELQQRQLAKPLRVLWLGDSHTAGVAWPASVEQTLLKQVPSGGPGYLPLGLANPRQHGARIFSDPSFEIAPHPPARRSLEDDGVFGLAGFRAKSRDKSLEVIVKFDQPTVQEEFDCQLFYRYQRASDRLVVSVAGKDTEVHPQTGGTSFPHGIHTFEFKVPTRAPLQIRTTRGSPELFGMTAETGTPGLVIDVLGINGARLATPLAWNSESWKALVAHRQPSLAVIAYGTNEVFDEVRPERYEPEIARLLERIRSAVPGIECLLAGPTDVGRGGAPAQQRVHAIDEMERRAAEQQGCAYFSLYQAMGGPSSFDEWLHAAPSLATTDGVHLTPSGYRKLGAQLGDWLLEGLPTGKSAVSPNVP